MNDSPLPHRKQLYLPYCTRSKTARIQHFDPHYTNSNFRNPQTVYLAKGEKLVTTRFGHQEISGASYDYSDRLWQWHGYDKGKAAQAAADAVNPERRCAEHLEVWLRELTGKPRLKLVHILASFNVSTLYPYQVYGYKVPKPAKE